MFLKEVSSASPRLHLFVSGKGGERGLNCRRQKGFINKQKRNKQQKLPRMGKKQTGKAGQGRTRGTHTTDDDELTQDCKHKEIINGEDEGNELTQDGQINQ